MLIRIVKMSFHEDRVDDFHEHMKVHAPRIRAFEGCEYLQFLRDKDRPGILFTYSHWRSEDDLENYRNSEVFNELWAAAKSRFNGKPEAWSVERMMELK